MEEHRSTNPYAPPATQSNVVKERFRPNPIARGICMLSRGGDRPARRDPVSGELLLRTGRPLLAFFWFCVVGVPTGVVFLAAANPPAPHERWAPWVLGAGFGLAGGAGLLASERVYASHELVRKVGPFGRRREIRWRDVAAITIDNSGTLTLRSAEGTRISVDAGMTGVADFLDLLHEKAPAEVRQDAELELLELRRFVSW